jgi:hypothetical protein
MFLTEQLHVSLTKPIQTTRLRCVIVFLKVYLKLDVTPEGIQGVLELLEFWLNVLRRYFGT